MWSEFYKNIHKLSQKLKKLNTLDVSFTKHKHLKLIFNDVKILFIKSRKEQSL